MLRLFTLVHVYRGGIGSARAGRGRVADVGAGALTLMPHEGVGWWDF